MKIFTPHVNLQEILDQTRTRGYAFVAEAIEATVCEALQHEINSLKLEVGDHINYPISKGTRREVRQRHGRAYRMSGHLDVPFASWLCRELADKVAKLNFRKELRGWLLNEIGYQRYASEVDGISPHKDRKSDRLLSVTVTIAGSAWVHMYDPTTDPIDYRRLQKVDSFLTAPGTVMFLRAPGFGSGVQEIHQVMPPVGEVSRDILNLRMRPNLLPRPGRELVEG